MPRYWQEQEDPLGESSYLALHSGAGWCSSDLDQTPCSFDCSYPYSTQAEIAEACYTACTADFPDWNIDNVEYGYSWDVYCYCQSGYAVPFPSLIPSRDHD